MLTSLFPMWPHQITLSEIYYNPYLWHFTLLSLARSRGLGMQTPPAPVGIILMMTVMTNMASFYHAQGSECTSFFFVFLVFGFCLNEPLIQPMQKNKEEKKNALTASDSVSFQSVCIRFITFLSLRLVDAPRVQLHWYGRRGLSCDYDIFLGALSSHSISLG